MKKVKPIGSTLKRLREKAGLTQREAHEAIGVPQSTFSSWERDIAEPPIETVIELCKLYKVRDVLKVFGLDGYNDDGTISLNINEETLIDNYRKLDRFDQETLEILADRMAQKISKKKKKPTIQEILDWDEPELLAAHGSENLDEEGLEQLHEDVKHGREIIKRKKAKNND